MYKRQNSHRNAILRNATRTNPAILSAVAAAIARDQGVSFVIRLIRLAIVSLIVASVTLLVGLLPAIMPPRPAHAAPPAASDPTDPTPELSATLHLSASRPVVAVGQTLRLTTDLSIAGCGYGVKMCIRDRPRPAPRHGRVRRPDVRGGQLRWELVLALRKRPVGGGAGARFALPALGAYDSDALTGSTQRETLPPPTKHCIE